MATTEGELRGRDGATIARLAPADTTVLRRCLDTIASALEDPTIHENDQHLSLLVTEQRTQMRYVVTAQDIPTSKVAREAAEAARVLSSILAPDVPHGDEVLDAFLYPPSSASPCPAHTDPGIATVICDTTPALEVQTSNGDWKRLELGEDEVAILAGRQLSGARACMHRVAPINSRRCSLVYERRLADSRAVGSSERQALLEWMQERRSTIVSIDHQAGTEQYPKAAGALARFEQGLSNRGTCLVS